ncbi:MAG: phage tail protein [Elusimicrobia bacterium]|nr:phage tail protein [Elusimicrobiota bacterium]
MKRMLATFVLLSATTSVFAGSYNNISVQGKLESAIPIYGVKVHVLSGGVVVGTASDVALIPDVDGFFSTQTYLSNPKIFLAGSEYTIRLSSSDATVISSFSLTAAPFALTVKGNAQTGDQNVFGAYGNVGIGTYTPNYRLVISSGAGTSGKMLVISTGTSEVIQMTGAGQIYATTYYGDGSSLTGLNACYTGGAGNTLVGVGTDGGLNGWSNTAMGYLASYSLEDGYENTFYGDAAGIFLSSGADNTFIGYEAAAWATSGSSNIIIGDREDKSLPDASNEVNIGGIIFGNRVAKTVGISTRTPQAALDVVSPGTFAQIWRNSSGVIQASMSATGVMMATNLTVTGNVGISSATPTQKLSIQGNVDISGDYYINGRPNNIGMVSFFASSGACPSGWVLADGKSYPTSTYPNLFAATGYVYGGASGNFSVPDLRGIFMRGWNYGSNGSTTISTDTGRGFGTMQTDAFQGHKHTFLPYRYNSFRGDAAQRWADEISSDANSNATYYTRIGAPYPDGSNGVPRTASETRPANIALLPCIKY